VLRHDVLNLNGQPKLPICLTLSEWRQIQAEYECYRHCLFADGTGGNQPRSHYQGSLAKYDGSGSTVQPDSETSSWGLELDGWGRLEEEVAIGG
jgi:hypothetical protein